MPMFPDVWIEELLSKNDIVSVIQEYVSLKPKGGRMWGCCPFHTEKTPSFSVTQSNQFYYCFGCHEHGTVISFIMNIEKLSYPDAVQFLAQRAHMELPGRIDDETASRNRQKRERMYAACKEAALYYHKALLGDDGEKARLYLKKRGIDPMTVKRFGLGYAKDGWDNLYNYLRELGYSKEELISSGLCQKSQRQDSAYDAFRDRLIFPIIATTGKVIGFGARTMKNEEPKYLNTGDTMIFNKRMNLYGLNMQRGKKLSDLILVEGYLDVISLYKSGVTNAVASLGTAFTQQQARLAKRYVSRLYVAYDGDAAGQNAALKAMEILSAEELNPKVIVFPGGMDPDDYINRKGKEEFLTLKDKALSGAEFRLERMADGIDFKDPDKREAYAKEACAYIATLQPVEQERYYSLVSHRTGITVSALTAQGGSSLKKERADTVRTAQLSEKPQQTERGKTEEMLFACIAGGGADMLETISRVIGEELFEEEAYYAFSVEMMNALVSQREPDIALLLNKMTPEDAGKCIEAIESSKNITDYKTQARDCIAAIKRLQLEEELMRVSLEYGKAQDDSTKKDCANRMTELTKRIKAMK